MTVKDEAAPVILQPIKDGPLYLRGPVDVVSGAGPGVERLNECWLCRCGASARKPFCDGSHKRLGFTADGKVR